MTYSLSTTWEHEVTWSRWSRSLRSFSGGTTQWRRYSSSRSTSAMRITQRSYCLPSLPASSLWQPRRNWLRKWALPVLASRFAKSAKFRKHELSAAFWGNLYFENFEIILADMFIFVSWKKTHIYLILFATLLVCGGGRTITTRTQPNIWPSTSSNQNGFKTW